MSNDLRCSDCKGECGIKPLDLSFDYAGTHCTGGKGGTHYPAGHGELVSDCCEADITTPWGWEISQHELKEIYEDV